MRPDKNRVDAILKMPAPKDRKELERFLGITNYLSRFIPNYSDLAGPLRDLLKKDNEFMWNEVHNRSLISLKEKVCEAPVLRYYSPDEEVTVSVDASQRGLGACLLQAGRPVAYAARTLTPAESRWAQIEKELLAIVFGCTRFHQYVYGHNQVRVETDHKPLESIFKKPLNSTPARLQRMLMKLHGYALKIEYKPGKFMHIADALSRAPAEDGSNQDVYEDVTVHVNLLRENLSVSEEKIQKIRDETSKDESLLQVQNNYNNGWPTDKRRLHDSVKQYWTFKDDLHVIEGIIFRNNQIVIPKSLRKEILARIHEGHLGIEKTKRRAREVVWWPGMGADIEQCVARCDTCQRHRASPRRQPLRPHAVPALPWEVLAADIFDIDQRHYLLIVDYYSKFVEVCPLGTNMTSAAIVSYMKDTFGRYGIPKKIVTDNGRQFVSGEFEEFSKSWEFDHVTSSPLYPQSNGLAERNVQTVKRLIIKARETKSDWQLALLNFRNTPLTGEEFSPAQLLMGRRLNTRLPAKADVLRPSTVDPSIMKEKRETNIQQQKQYYDRGTRALPKLEPGEEVRMREKKIWVKAKVKDTAGDEDRSYWVETEGGGTYRRNRTHLLKRRTPSQYKGRVRPSVVYDDDIIYEGGPSNVRRSLEAASPRPSACARDAAAGVTPPPPAPAPSSAGPSSYYTTRSGRQIRPPNRFL